MIDPDDKVLISLLTATYGWVPPQIKAVFAERQGVDVTVHLGCVVRDARVQEAEDDIDADVDNETGTYWNYRGLQTHVKPDIADWRTRGWIPVHLSAEWGGAWIEPGDGRATGDRAPEWTPDAQELAAPDLIVRPPTLPPSSEANFLVAMAHSAAGQITPAVRAVNALVGTTRTDIYWHLDTPPDAATAKAMNVTALRLQENYDREFVQRWYVKDPHPPRTLRWELIFGRDDPRTLVEREAERGE